MKVFHKILCMSTIVLLMACSNNTIYYDKDAKAIKTCGNENLISLMINTDKGTFYYKLKRNVKKRNIFFLYEPNMDYFLDKKNSTTLLDSFSIAPNANYTFINFSYGDATHAHLDIQTDTLGHVLRASRIGCR